MNSDILFIEITFENLDYIVIPSNYFEDFEMKNIRSTVRSTATNAILKYSEITSIHFELNKQANADVKSFAGDIHSVWYENETFFSRLQHPDITRLKLIYTDKTENVLHVPWEDADSSGYTNRLQHCTIDTTGNQLLRIAFT